MFLNSGWHYLSATLLGMLDLYVSNNNLQKSCGRLKNKQQSKKQKHCSQDLMSEESSDMQKWGFFSP